MNKHENDSYGLLAWIKKDQEERRQHQEKMAIRNYKDDQVYMKHLAELVASYAKMHVRDRQLLVSMIRWHREGRCFSTKQRSAIASMYMRYELK